MRTAVIRINVDPQGVLANDLLSASSASVAERAVQAGMQLVFANIAEASAHRREMQFLVTTDDVAGMREVAAAICAEAFGTSPAPGVVTYLSRGTDDDARGVLASFGLTGDISRTSTGSEYDIVSIRIAREDLERVPESRIQTALEASLNCEVLIVAM